MAQGTPYVGEVRSSVAANGVVTNMEPTAFATALGAGNYVTPSSDFTIDYHGTTIEGMKGVPIPTDAAMKIYLLANAPVA